jgi:hypothetical protein
MAEQETPPLLDEDDDEDDEEEEDVEVPPELDAPRPEEGSPENTQNDDANADVLEFAVPDGLPP